MLLNFKAQFVPLIEAGEKTHTIRARSARVGETLHLYTGLRRKGARLLGRFECVKVEQIEITAHEVRIDGQVLSRDERAAFAARDGFGGKDAWESMLAFWEGRLPFHGFIIHWRRQPLPVTLGGRT